MGVSKQSLGLVGPLNYLAIIARRKFIINHHDLCNIYQAKSASLIRKFAHRVKECRQYAESHYFQKNNFPMSVL